MPIEWPVHPAADLFPMLPDEELRALANDIKANGLTDPVVLYCDPERGTVLLDGRNRTAACAMVGVQPTTRTFDGDDPVRYVVSKNLRRRDLTPGQRAMLGVELEPMYADEAKARQGKRSDLNIQAPGPECSKPAPQARDKAAAAVKTSGRAVGRAKRVAIEAPDLAERVKTGELPLRVAEEELKRRQAPEEEMTEKAGGRRERALAREAEVIRLDREGVSRRSIAAQLGIAESTISKYLVGAGRAETSSRAAIDRLVSSAAGLADAADRLDGRIQDPTSSEVTRWVGDLTRAIRALSQLRTRIKETNQP